MSLEKASRDQSFLRFEMTDIPTQHGIFKMGTIESDIESHPHVVLVLGDIQKEGVLTRIHSECFTGDIFGSFRCDCNDQLSKALQNIGSAGSGVLIYMRQEGRGIGLTNKLKAYRLQDSGFDTIDANLELGLPVDARDYTIAAQVLNALGVTSVRLMTNNPDKIAAMKMLGIAVDERMPLIGQKRHQSQRYVTTKIERLGHLISS
jgi:3,4-dihydroxy 2-butanone 4-phosphate synthase / GTP cyclohydrolase II